MDDNTTLVLIFAVIFGCEALSRHLRTKQATAKQKQSNLALEAEIQQLNANQTQLIERIQTLEAIVTDDGYQLKQEVKKLA
ncbi:hypothetical protein SOPP22_02165 [Shewanella sp. OPT22]|nr:hypothetical protein SOPP22_02165 [Shewanella sp. OPT22]